MFVVSWLAATSPASARRLKATIAVWRHQIASDDEQEQAAQVTSREWRARGEAAKGGRREFRSTRDFGEASLASSSPARSCARPNMPARGADEPDLEGADLEGADLEGADLEGADLEGTDLEGTHVLVVEDDLLISMELTSVLTAAGADVIGPSHTVAHALALVDREDISVAVLDVRLGDETVAPVARGLWRRENSIRFLHGSGTQ